MTSDLYTLQCVPVNKHYKSHVFSRSNKKVHTEMSKSESDSESKLNYLLTGEVAVLPK